MHVPCTLCYCIITYKRPLTLTVARASNEVLLITLTMRGKKSKNSTTRSGVETRATSRQHRATVGQKRQAELDDDTTVGPSSEKRQRGQPTTPSRPLTTDDIPGLVKAIFEAMPATTRSPTAEVTLWPDIQSSRQISTNNRCDLVLEDEESPDISKQPIITSVN